MRYAARLKRISARIRGRHSLRFDGILSLYQVEGCGPGAIACGRETACGPGRRSAPIGAAAVRWASACPSAYPHRRTLRDRRCFLVRVASGGRIRDRPAAALRIFPWVHSRPPRTVAGSSSCVTPPDTAYGGSRRRHGRKAHARDAHCPLPPKAAAGHLRYAARRARGPPLMRMVARTRRAIHARAARRRPRPQGAGHGRRGPRPLLPTGNAGPRPLLPMGNAGPPPASASAPPPHGGIPPPGPPKGGTFGGAGAQRPLFLPPCGCGCAACRGFLPAPPRPSPAGPRGARGHTACGRRRGPLASARVLLQGHPLRLAARTRSAYKGKRASAPRYISPLDKLPRYLVRYSCEVTPAAFAALPSTSMVRRSPPSTTGGFCYTWDTESATFAASNAPNATKPRYFVAFARPKQKPPSPARERQQKIGFVAFRARGVVAALLKRNPSSLPPSVLERPYHTRARSVNSPSCDSDCDYARFRIFLCFARSSWSAKA